MTECTSTPPQAAFSFFGPRQVTVTFDDGHISNDAGVLLLRQLDDRLGLTRELSRSLVEWRNPLLVEHSLLELVRERVFGIAHGYEDCNDAAALRKEPLFKAACDRSTVDDALASQPSLSRFENRAGKGGLAAAKEVLTDHFIRRYQRRCTRPRRLTIDLDTTADETHGQQEFALFNGYYDAHCYQQLLIHDAEGDLLYCALLPGKGDVRGPALAALRHLVERLRAAFPKLELRLRADNGFACPELYDYCEDNGIEYFVNVGTHRKMVDQTEGLQQRAVDLFNAGDQKAPVQVFGEFAYQANTWRQVRRIVAKAAETLVGPDQRMLVTNSRLDPVEVYQFYAGRGQEENWIKDLKRGLKSDRLSCSAFAANELRLVLFSLAYQLLHELRRRVGQRLRKIRLDTLRVRLLRVAARVKTTARRLWVRVSETYPWRDDWLRLARSVGAAVG
jgi:Transposase DDE domain group 1